MHVRRILVLVALISSATTAAKADPVAAGAQYTYRAPFAAAQSWHGTGTDITGLSSSEASATADAATGNATLSTSAVSFNPAAMATFLGPTATAGAEFKLGQVTTSRALQGVIKIVGDAASHARSGTLTATGNIYPQLGCTEFCESFNGHITRSDATGPGGNASNRRVGESMAFGFTLHDGCYNEGNPVTLELAVLFGATSYVWGSGEAGASAALRLEEVSLHEVECPF